MPMKVSKSVYSTAKKFGISAKRTRSLANKRRKPRYPTRLQGSRLNYQIAKQVSKAMSNVSESKILPMTKFNEVNPTPIQALSQAYTTSYVIGTIPTVWSGITGINSLTNFEFPQGDGQASRDGDSVYLKKSHLALDIEMNQALPSRQVCEFRVIAFKSTRATTPAGTTHNWGASLFLDIDGSYVGHQTAGINGTDLMRQPINKKYWSVMADKKFILSPVADGASPGSAHTGVNACKRSFTFNIPYNKKVSFEHGNAPDDIDYRMCIAVFAKTVGRDGVADVWETNVRGLTTYLDN